MKERRKREESSPEEAAEPREPAGPRAADERIAELESEREELRAHWQRAQADYQNLRRRVQADSELAARRSLQPLLDELLLVLDFLDLAIASPTTTEEARNLAKGVEMTRGKLLAALQREEVVPIRSEGAFDPELHEATATVEREDVPPGTIVETIRTGYTWRGNVLRPAHVVVATAGDDERAEESEAGAEARH